MHASDSFAHNSRALLWGMEGLQERVLPQNSACFGPQVIKQRGEQVHVLFARVQVKSVRWDEALGGQTLELRLLEHFATEFNAKMGRGFDVRQWPKSMAKLRKAVKRTKEVLSANTEAPIIVESLYEENDFK